jgi:hypothetical protein
MPPGEISRNSWARLAGPDHDRIESLHGLNLRWYH